jgi:hypothetical protein
LSQAASGDIVQNIHSNVEEKERVRKKGRRKKEITKIQEMPFGSFLFQMPLHAQNTT